MNMWYKNWLVGSNGVHIAAGDGTWKRIGRPDYGVNDIVRIGASVYSGVGCGVWDVSLSNGAWTQLHDETVTEVLAIAPASGDPGVIIGCPYGVATGKRDGLGAVRWTFHSDDLAVNQRFTVALLSMGEGLYLVGTEDGVLVFDGRDWERTDLNGRAARALLSAHGSYWAGTDESGIWKSGDGVRWAPAGTGIGDETVFDLTATGRGVVAASASGFLEGDGVGRWLRSGPRIRAVCVEAHPRRDGHWLGGAHPGGLWMTEDGGGEWRQCGEFTRVSSIVPAGEVEP